MHGLTLAPVQVKFGVDEGEADNVSFNPETGSSTVATVTAAGRYRLYADRSTDDSKDVSQKQYLILYQTEVIEIKPDVGDEIDDEDGDDKTKLYYVRKEDNGTINVDTKLNPSSVTEDNSPYNWTMNGGDGALKLKRTIDKTVESETELTYNFGSSDSGYKTKVVVANISIKTPSGDPSTNAGANVDNERTYSSAATDPIVTVVCEAEDSILEEKLRWKIEDIGNIKGEWNPHMPGDKHTGKGKNSTVTFTGLPAKNSDFGAKKITLYVDGVNEVDEQTVEIFFDRDASNHPGGNANEPNWFYYWSQVHVNNNVHYVALANKGRTIGMTAWSYNQAPNKQRIEIGAGHPDSYRSYGIGELASGIDRFIMTIIHEEKHVLQIQAADAILVTNGADSFRHGWSWNKQVHNHWTKGPDIKWGVANLDDDINILVDDASITPPFEPGNGDDVNLDHVNIPQWPNAWDLPGGVYKNIHPIEGEAVKWADNAMNEHDNADKDWGDPGKNHKTINKWND